MVICVNNQSRRTRSQVLWDTETEGFLYTSVRGVGYDSGRTLSGTESEGVVGSQTMSEKR